MRYTEWILLLVLIAGTAYNVQNPILRIMLISSWAFLPGLIVLISYRSRFYIQDRILFEIIPSFFLLFFLLFSIIINNNTFNMSFDGASVEMLTVFLFIFTSPLLIFYSKLTLIKVNKNFIFYFMLGMSIILLFDVVIRYIGSPSCFMNYSCRGESKVLGFFNNSNITGQITVFLIVISWFLSFRAKKIFQFVFFAFLIMALARSAWVSLFVVFVLSQMFLIKSNFKYLLSLGAMFFLIFIVVIDPLDLKNDGSGLSKLNFFIRVGEIIHEGSWLDIFFGYGASFNYIVDLIGIHGWSPHASILKAFLYYGVTGILAFFYILLKLIRFDRRMLLPTLSFLIFGLAGGPIFWPTLSVGLILLMVENNIVENYRENRGVNGSSYNYKCNK